MDELDMIAAANQRHDQEHGPIREFEDSRIRSTWNPNNIIRRGRLSDRKIEKYAEAGYYSPEFRIARKAHNERKGKRPAAGGSRVVEVEPGRFVYRI